MAVPGNETSRFLTWKRYLEGNGFWVQTDDTISEIAHVDTVNMIVKYDPNRFTRIVQRHEQFHVSQYLKIKNESPEFLDDWNRAGSRLSRLAEAATVQYELRLAQEYATTKGLTLNSNYVDGMTTLLSGGDAFLGFNLQRVLRRVARYPNSTDARLWDLVNPY